MIQTTQGWIRDLFEREQCGITVPPGNAAALARAVVVVARNAAVRDPMAANALRVAKCEFDRDRLAAKMRAVLLAAGGR